MKEYFEKKLNEALSYYNTQDNLYKAIEYSINSGGKRIRPLLVLYFSEVLNIKKDEIVDIAIAIEFIHNYSLVHDDLPGMDNDKYRRGKLTTHAKFGEYIGILVGDALLTEAFSIIARSEKLKNKDKLIECLSKNAGLRGMVQGQYLDMQNLNKKLDEKTINTIHEYKTGALIKACFEMVMIHKGLENEKYLKIATLLGLIYQLQDDIFDSKNETDNSNYVNILGEMKAKEKLEKYIKELKELLPINTNLTQFIMKIIERQK